MNSNRPTPPASRLNGSKLSPSASRGTVRGAKHAIALDLEAREQQLGEACDKVLDADVNRLRSGHAHRRPPLRHVQPARHAPAGRLLQHAKAAFRAGVPGAVQGRKMAVWRLGTGTHIGQTSAKKEKGRSIFLATMCTRLHVTNRSTSSFSF